MVREHHDFEPFELAENMQQDLGMFEAATHSRRLKLDQNPVSNILLVSDNGPLNQTVGELGKAVARRLNSTTSEYSVDTARLQDAAREIGRSAEESNAGLIVIPVPCGMGNDGSGQDSPGSVVDQLLHVVTRPMLCVRQPLDPSEISQSFRHLQVAMIRDDAPTTSTISWVFRLADHQSQIRLVELADRKSLEEARQLLHAREEVASVQEAAIERAVNSRMGSIVAIAQREASARRIGLQVSFQLGAPAREVLNEMKSHVGGLTFMARPEDRTASGFHLVVDVLLRADQPVFII